MFEETYLKTQAQNKLTKLKINNYEDLCYHCFGLKGYLVVSISMLIFDFGAMMTYLIILGDAAQKVADIFGYDSLFHLFL